MGCIGSQFYLGRDLGGFFICDYGLVLGVRLVRPSSFVAAPDTMTSSVVNVRKLPVDSDNLRIAVTGYDMIVDDANPL